MLKEEVNLLNTLKLLRNEAMFEKGESQEATRLRNKKMEELEVYSHELRSIAKIALMQKSQLLEVLGILVRS